MSERIQIHTSTTVAFGLLKRADMTNVEQSLSGDMSEARLWSGVSLAAFFSVMSYIICPPISPLGCADLISVLSKQMSHIIISTKLRSIFLPCIASKSRPLL